MRLEVFYINDDINTKITIWNRTKDDCIVQETIYGKKSRKSKAKIKYYNDKPYINCKGHRYYLGYFKEVNL